MKHFQDLPKHPGYDNKAYDTTSDVNSTKSNASNNRSTAQLCTNEETQPESQNNIHNGITQSGRYENLDNVDNEETRSGRYEDVDNEETQSEPYESLDNADMFDNGNYDILDRGNVNHSEEITKF